MSAANERICFRVARNARDNIQTHVGFFLVYFVAPKYARFGFFHLRVSNGRRLISRSANNIISIDRKQDSRLLCV